MQIIFLYTLMMKNMYIGSYVSRKKYNNDIVFKIIDISNDIYILKGVDYRLLADSYLDDLSIVDYKYQPYYKKIVKRFDNRFNYIIGSVLHLDSDVEYLDKCIEYYKVNCIKCYGYIFKEYEYKDIIIDLIIKHNPSVVVITGHDFYKNGKYKNSYYYASCVKTIRKYFPNIIIISGACQSNFYLLISSGSTFASSPGRVNVHALDPAIIASYILLTEKNKEIDVITLLNCTFSGYLGYGGFVVKGLLKKLYPGKGLF